MNAENENQDNQEDQIEELISRCIQKSVSLHNINGKLMNEIFDLKDEIQILTFKCEYLSTFKDKCKQLQILETSLRNKNKYLIKENDKYADFIQGSILLYIILVLLYVVSLS